MLAVVVEMVETWWEVYVLLFVVSFIATAANSNINASAAKSARQRAKLPSKKIFAHFFKKCHDVEASCSLDVLCDPTFLS